MTTTTTTTTNFTCRKRKQPCGVDQREVSKRVSSARASQNSRKRRFEKRIKTLENLKEQKKRLDEITELKTRLKEAEDKENQYQQSRLEVMKIRSNLAQSNLNMQDLQKIAKQMPFGFVKSLLLRDRNFILSSLLSFPTSASSSTTAAVFYIDAFRSDDPPNSMARYHRFAARLVPEKSTSFETVQKAQKDYEATLCKRMADYYEFYGWNIKHRNVNGNCACGKNNSGACPMPAALRNHLYDEPPLRPETKLVFRTLATILKHPEQYELYDPEIKRAMEQGFEITLRCSNPCLSSMRALRHRHILSRERRAGSITHTVSMSNREDWMKRLWREWIMVSGPWVYRLNIDVFLSSTSLRTDAHVLHDDLYMLIQNYL